MRDNLSQLSQQARFFVQQRNWAKVYPLAKKITVLYNNDPEGHFLKGLADKAAGQVNIAINAFTHALHLAPQRYDAAIELAQL